MVTRKTHVKATDLRGAARLATDATQGLADLVEAMHERIGRLPGLPPGAAPGRTRGITGLVYRSVRGVTRLVGGSVDGMLALLEPMLGPTLAAPGATTSPEREALLSALNGVLGDRLATNANPLATTMGFYRGQQALITTAPLGVDLVPASGPLLLQIHGLCMNHLQWQHNGHDHGQALARDAGYTTLGLRYNSGLHIAANGLALAQQLERLLGQRKEALGRVLLLCHSMGGLVARSALAQGQALGQRWPGMVDDLVFLGTPHQGAPLERVGQWLHLLLGATPYAAPIGQLAGLRSAGITDLRHGAVLPSEEATDAAAASDRFARSNTLPRHLPLPQQPRCYAVAGQLGEPHQALKNQLLGDGLVPLASALGQHDDPARCLHFEPGRTWVGHGLGHMALLADARVYAQLRAWLG